MVAVPASGGNVTEADVARHTTIHIFYIANDFSLSMSLGQSVRNGTEHAFAGAVYQRYELAEIRAEFTPAKAKASRLRLAKTGSPGTGCL